MTTDTRPDAITIETHLSQLRLHRNIVAAMERQFEAWGLNPDTGLPYPQPGDCRPAVLADADGWIVSCPTHQDIAHFARYADAQMKRVWALEYGCEAVKGER